MGCLVIEVSLDPSGKILDLVFDLGISRIPVRVPLEK